MGRRIIHDAITIDGAFEAPTPPPDGWLVLDPDFVAEGLHLSYRPASWRRIGHTPTSDP